MTKGWPSCSWSLAAMMRAAMSVACPGGHGTITLTGRLGYACAATGRQKAKTRETPKTGSSAASSSEGSWIRPAVEQQVLAGNVPRLGAAQIGACVAELLDGAESARGVRVGARFAELIDRLSGRLGVERQVRAQAVGLERPGE